MGINIIRIKISWMNHTRVIFQLIATILLSFGNLLATDSNITDENEEQFLIGRQPLLIYGIHAGIAISNEIELSESPIDRINTDYRTSYNIGFTVEYNRNIINLPLRFETGIFYIQKGTHVGDVSHVLIGDGLIQSLTNLRTIYHYLQIPANFMYNVWYGDTDINLIGGGFISPLISTEYVSDQQQGDINLDVVNPIDFGISIGANYSFTFDHGKDKIGLSYSYQLGFLSPFDDDYANSSHVVNVFYKFDL